MDNKAMHGQRPTDNTELERAMLAGTDEAAARQQAVWSRIAAGRAKPRRSPAGPLALTVAAVAVAAVLLFGLPGWLPQADIVRPMASGAASPIQAKVFLSANVQLYAPTMSSVQGITVTARDGQGNAVEGDWATSWGVFLGPVSRQGNLVPSTGEPTTTLESAARAMWSFPLDSGDIPQTITVTYTAPDGQLATLTLERDREHTGFVRVVQPLEALNLLVNVEVYIADPMRNAVSMPIAIEAVDASGAPVRGDWAASFGLLDVEGRSFSGNQAKAANAVRWTFTAGSADQIPAQAQITFTAGGHSKTLHLIKDPDYSWTLRVSPADLLYIPKDKPAETHPVSTDPTTPPPAEPRDDPTTMASAALSARQTVEAYFQAWQKKDSTLMRGFVVDNMKDIDYELDKLKDIILLSCEDQTAGRRQMFSSAWYANPADIAIFHVRFRVQCSQPDGVVSGMTDGEHEMAYYLVKETADGPWIIVMWGN